MLNNVEITTSRLILKAITPAIIHNLFHTKTKEEIMIFFGVDENGYAHFKNMHDQGMETHRLSMFFFLLIDKNTNLPIGECGFHTWNKTHARAELFYSLKKDSHKQKGLMTEVLPYVLNFGFSTLKLHRIEALVAHWNIPSVKLLLRHGFVKEGTMREDYIVNGKHEDSDCYSLLQHEWKHNKYTVPMDQYKETFNTWNKIAELYQDKFMKLDLYNNTYDFFCDAIVKPNAKLLEIGCGPGNITKYLLEKNSHFDILGIDIAPNMVELAKKNNPTANFAVMDTREINTLTTKFDGIIAGFCLPYLSQTECQNFILNSYNLLNDNGVIYLSFVEGNDKDSGFKVGSAGRVYFYYHNLKALREQLIKTKFQGIEIFNVDYKRSETETEIHTILIAKKSHNFSC